MTTPTAPASVTASLLAAAWRENLNGLRDRARVTPAPPDSGGDRTATEQVAIHIDSPGGSLSTTARPGPFDQITPTGPVRLGTDTVTDPVTLLHALAPDPPGHLARELRDAVTGLNTALPRHRHLTRAIADSARHHGHDSTIALAETLSRRPGFVPCRFFEPLAVDGHHLHPCARTRLGWSPADRQSYDLETPHPIGVRFVAVHRDHAATAPHPGALTDHLTRLHPPLAQHRDDEHVIIPVHPWQHRHLRDGPARGLFADGTLRDLDVPDLDTAPTASIRTLVTGDGTYLKCSLSIHITSTTRGISPATVHNGPVLSRLLRDIITADPRLAPRIDILAEHAGAGLPHEHPNARDLSCLLRAPLSDVTTPGELAVPATALPAISPVTGTSIAAELLARSGLDPETFLHHYTALLAGTTIRLATGYGIGTEAHLQNCVPTFVDGTPHRVILRDLGGCRLHLPHLHRAGHRPGLHPASVITTTDPDVVRAKVAYTVFQNHLAAITTALARDTGLAQDKAWRTIADTIDTLGIPAPDRDFYTAATVPHKALLSMRLNPGGDLHVPVANPLARP